MKTTIPSKSPRARLATMAVSAIALMYACNAAASPVSSNTSLPDTTSKLAKTIQTLRIDNAVVLRNSGKDSAQILWPKNAPNAQVTITRVIMQPGAISERHKHPRSEQIWMVEQGHGTMLKADGKTQEIKAGDLVDTPPGTTHGVENTGNEIFIYLSITTPPEDFSQYYKGQVQPK